MVLAFAVEPGGADHSHATATAMHILLLTEYQHQTILLCEGLNATHAIYAGMH